MKFQNLVAIFVGPIVGGLFFWILPELSPGQPTVNIMAGIALWMAIWWLTEALPLAVTALLPLLLFPLSGVAGTDEIAPSYMDDVLILVIGGYFVAFAMERWNLHQRIGLRIILWTGTAPDRILLGFMLAVWFLSLWISNTAALLMMMPTCMAILNQIKAQGHEEKEVRRFGGALLLGLAYAATLGGIGTLIGTFPNLIFKKMYAKEFPDLPEINFLQWSLFALPLSLLLLVGLWFYLRTFVMRKVHLPDEGGMFQKAYRDLGPWTYEQKIVMFVFTLLAVAWFTKGDIDFGGFKMRGWTTFLPHGKLIRESTLAVAASLLLFLIPSRSEPKRRILTWDEAKHIPVEMLLLFGGGFALARGFEISGLSEWLALHLQGLQGLPTWLLVGSICLIVTLFSELASNTATATLVLPILAILARTLGIPPWQLMVPATLAASFGFMMPVGTPPNLIAYGTGWIPLKQMVRAGFWLDIAGILAITLFTFLFGNLVFG